MLLPLMHEVIPARFEHTAASLGHFELHPAILSSRVDFEQLKLPELATARSHTCKMSSTAGFVA